MKRKEILLLASLAIAMTTVGCQRDTFGDLFVKRKSLIFHVQSDSGQDLSGVCLKTVECDAFDGDPIVGRTNYTYTDEDGLVTVKAAFDEEPGYSSLIERTTRFTFTATNYIEYDTLFNYWEDTVDIVLHRQ